MKALRIKTLIVLWLALGAACTHNPKEPTDTPTSGEITIACADNFRNVLSASIDAFHAHNEKAFIIPLFLPENEVIALLLNDSVRLAIAARDLTPAERRGLEPNRVIRKYIVAFEGIAIVGNKTNTDTLLTVPQLKKILLGEITDWNQINPKSKLGKIQVLFDSQESSVLQFVADSVAGRSDSLSPNLFAAKGIADLRDKIAALPGAIGILGFNQLGNETTKTHKEFMQKNRFMWLAHNDTAQAALPFAGDLHKGEYPLWRPIYALLGEIRNGLPKGFTFFLTQDIGQKVILKAGLMPIADPQNILLQVGE
ncbi:MAG: substrate-binding domain-containing protein [Bacteroidales bacterium]|nr:substrate-binding domain-containing protein [Bacteroidales bacterium]